MTRITDAINAYSAMGQALEQSTSTAPEIKPGEDFAAVLQTAAKGSIDTLKDAEAMTAAGIAGKADIRDVVAAVNNAEATLETVVAVRDKVVTAYNEIMRLSI